MPVPNYNPYYYPQQYNQQVQSQAMQIQNGGFIPVPSEDVARNYPVAPGNSVTFKNENAPYVYTKTMGFSQLDRPLFERYKLVKEEDEQFVEPPKNENENIYEEMQKQIELLWGEVNALKQPKKPATDEKRKNDRGGRYDKQRERHYESVPATEK